MAYKSDVLLLLSSRAVEKLKKNEQLYKKLTVDKDSVIYDESPSIGKDGTMLFYWEDILGLAKMRRIMR